MLSPYRWYIPFFRNIVSPALALPTADWIVGYWSGTVRVLDCALTMGDGSNTIDVKNNETNNNARIWLILPISTY
jgi:hypothetical protein